MRPAVLRIRAEREITRGRAAIVKAWYLRNTKDEQLKEVMTVELNEQSNYLPYLLGRLFAVLEDVQQRANPGISTTIKDRYFNSASATPATVFPLLINLAQKHLTKLDKGLAIHYNRKITELNSLSAVISVNILHSAGIWIKTGNNCRSVFPALAVCQILIVKGKGSHQAFAQIILFRINYIFYSGYKYRCQNQGTCEKSG